MTRCSRAVAAVPVGFVAYRITVELLAFGIALLLGVAVGVAVWLLTASAGGPSSVACPAERPTPITATGLSPCVA